MITPMGIRDKARTIKLIKHPQRQRDALYRFLEDIADALERQEQDHALHVTMLAQEHRAEVAELERRFNEQVEKIERRFVCDRCDPSPCVCYPVTPE